MSTLRGRDKRAQRIGTVEQKRSIADLLEVPEWWRDFYARPEMTDDQDDPNGAEDMTYHEAQRMYG